MGVAFEFDNDSFTDFSHRQRTEDAANLHIEGTNLLELPLIAAVAALSIAIGAAFNYRRWKRSSNMEGERDSEHCNCCRKEKREQNPEYKRSILESSMSNDLNFSYEVRADPMIRNETR